MFKTLVGKYITIELKNDLVMSGELDSIDPYLNMKLTKIHVLDEANHPQMVAMVRHVSPSYNASLDVRQELLHKRKRDSSRSTAKGVHRHRLAARCYEKRARFHEVLSRATWTNK
jgi:small nuclear ribonucleoprotein (snRNP)-like protein